MSPRINYLSQSAELFKGLTDLGNNTKKSLDPLLTSLVEIRASQLNGCAFCLDMHVKEAKIHGERELRLHHVAVWRESQLFSAKERAALELTELLTELNDHGIPDPLFAAIKTALSEKEISDIVFLIGVINFWNRLNLASPKPPGSLDKYLQLERAGLS